jgi:hypothetical protein
MAASDKAVEAIAAFLDAVDAGIVQARRILGQPTEKKATWNPSNVKWVEQPATDKGPYEKATDQDNANNPDYEAMKKDLDQPKHQGGYLYWQFTGGGAVGRRKKAAKK